MVNRADIEGKVTEVEGILIDYYDSFYPVEGAKAIVKETSFLINTIRKLLDENLRQLAKIHSLENQVKNNSDDNGMNAVDFHTKFSKHQNVSMGDYHVELIEDSFDIVLDFLATDNTSPGEIRKAIINYLDAEYGKPE